MSTITTAPATAQKAQILEYLEKGQALTPSLARKLFGCDRLGARVFDLRKEGHAIEGVLVKTRSGKRVARYTLQP